MADQKTRKVPSRRTKAKRSRKKTKEDLADRPEQAANAGAFGGGSRICRRGIHQPRRIECLPHLAVRMLQGNRSFDWPTRRSKGIGRMAALAQEELASGPVIRRGAGEAATRDTSESKKTSGSKPTVETQRWRKRDRAEFERFATRTAIRLAAMLARARGIAALVVCLLAATGDTPADRAWPVVLACADQIAAFDASSHAAAEAAARLFASAAAAESGAQSLQTAAATDFLLEALLLNGRGTETGTRQLAEQALSIKEQLLPADDVEMSPSVRNLATALAAAGQVKQALILFQRDVAIRERSRGRDDPSVADALDNLARAHLQSDRTPTRTIARTGAGHQGAILRADRSGK